VVSGAPDYELVMKHRSGKEGNPIRLVS